MTDANQSDAVVVLLPCPFCGCDRSVAAEGFAEFDDEPDWAVICIACHAEVPGDTKETAVAAWNTRATPDAGGGKG